MHFCRFLRSVPPPGAGLPCELCNGRSSEACGVSPNSVAFFSKRVAHISHRSFRVIFLQSGKFLTVGLLESLGFSLAQGRRPAGERSLAARPESCAAGPLPPAGGCGAWEPSAAERGPFTTGCWPAEETKKERGRKQKKKKKGKTIEGRKKSPQGAVGRSWPPGPSSSRCASVARREARLRSCWREGA